MNRLYLLFIFSILILGCKAQSNEEKMIATTQKILKYFEQENSIAFEKSIGVDLDQIGKIKELIDYDFNKIKLFLKTYSNNNTPKIIVTDGYNEVGKKKILVEILNKYDRANNISKVELQLFFGPPNFVSLDKISGYKIVVDKNVPNSRVVAPATQENQHLN